MAVAGRSSGFMSSVRKWAYNLSGFNKYGLHHNDCLDEGNPDVAEALRRLPEHIIDERNFRILKAMQLSITKTTLPKEEWVKYEEVGVKQSSKTIGLQRSSSPMPSNASFSTHDGGAGLLEDFNDTLDNFSDNLFIDEVLSVLSGDLISPFYSQTVDSSLVEEWYSKHQS